MRATLNLKHEEPRERLRHEELVVFVRLLWHRHLGHQTQQHRTSHQAQMRYKRNGKGHSERICVGSASAPSVTTPSAVTLDLVAE